MCSLLLKMNYVPDLTIPPNRLHWDMKELTAPEGAPYTIVYQADHPDGGREFVVAFPHPVGSYNTLYSSFSISSIVSWHSSS